MTLEREVKLVVWDLDDTFWKGTLSEQAIEPIADNIELVRTLADRGILCSICSKNDPEAAEAQLRALGIWEFFVLPSIAFQSKGQAIAQLIEALQLRPANTVFVDDNPSVLAEAAFTCPDLQCLSDPRALLDELDSPFLQGKADPDHTRLAQYQALAARHAERQRHDASDASFLRQSEIRIEIDYAVEPHLDRIIELINRSNQLNFTKIRIVSDADRTEFIESLSRFGFKAGIVRVWDKYADYGIVGFFLTLATLREYRLEHFVFSCRIMNMGVEQFVHDYLNRPEIRIAEPVANGLDDWDQVDWIAFGSGADASRALKEHHLVLIGGCDMLQLSTYCSSHSAEFTNRDFNGVIKRLDDPFLILDDPAAVEASPLRPHIPAFTHAEMIELRAALSQADAVIVSFYRMMEINYFRGRDGLMVRFDEDAVKHMLGSDQGLWFVRNFAFVELGHEQRQALIQASLTQLAQLTPPHCKLIVILENRRKLEQNPNEDYLRGLYNDFVTSLGATIDKLRIIDINQVTNVDWLFDDGFHMSRQGYYELAQAVKAVVDR